MACRVAGPHSHGFLPMVKHERMCTRESSTQSTGAKACYSGIKLQPQIKSCGAELLDSFVNRSRQSFAITEAPLQGVICLSTVTNK